MSKIIILAGSVRKGGNTELLARSFAAGAEKNNDVEIISVADINVNPCTGCDRCFTSPGNECVQHDDMTAIYEKLKTADMLVIASPVYFYGISAQLKTVVDRLHTPMRNTFKIRKLALLLAGAAELPEMFDSILMQYTLVLNYFNLEDAGKVLARGFREPGTIKNSKFLDEAYNFGLRIKE